MVVYRYNYMARAILEQHIACVRAEINKLGKRPGFDVLLQRAKKLNAQLTDAAMTVIAKAKVENDIAPEVITGEMHEIIVNSVEEYIGRL